MQDLQNPPTYTVGYSNAFVQALLAQQVFFYVFFY